MGNPTPKLHSHSQLRQQGTRQHPQQASQIIVKQDSQTPTTVHASADSRDPVLQRIDRCYKEDCKFNVVIHGIEECCTTNLSVEERTTRSLL